MKKWGVVIAAAVLLVGIGVAVAVGGSETDPLISKSYVEGTFLTNLAERLQKQAAEASRSMYSTLVGKLDALGEADVAQADAVNPGGYGAQSVGAGDTLTLKTGASLVIYSGKAAVTGGTLADVTAGAALETGGAAQAGHRYIVTGGGGASLRFDGAASVGYEGEGTLTAGQGGTAALPFADVKANDWFYGAVSFVFERGYFSGVSATAFAPGTPMDRAMLATVLYRLSGSKDKAQSAPFTDIPMGTWYTDPVAWASAKGVVNGMGGGLYDPERPVTREQMVTMLHRYVTNVAKKQVSAGADDPTFPDWDKVSDWAREGARWAAREGLIRGRDTGYLDPGGTATRAEVATILQRFAEWVEKN